MFQPSRRATFVLAEYDPPAKIPDGVISSGVR